jgi:hypothetical protein
MVLALLIAVVLLALPAAAQAKGPGDVTCEQHIEGPGSIRLDRSRDVVRGDMAFVGGRLVQQHRMPMGPDQMRLGVRVAAGHGAMVEVAPESREAVALQYRLEGSERPPEITTTFVPCDPGMPRFNGRGTVGDATVWAGGLLVRTRTCARLLVWVDGVRQRDVRLPVGLPCKPPAATRAVGCARQSGASFPGAFSDPRNLNVGPMTIVGGAEAARAASAPVIRELGWWKAPLLLREGAKVVVSVAWQHRRLARVGWSTGAEGRSLRLEACGTGSDSDVDGTPVTFWSGGFALARVPACVALDVWVGLENARRLRVPFGSPGVCR